MLLTDLRSAFMLLTRLPVARGGQTDTLPELGRCVWAFPLVGVVVGGIGGLVYWLARWLGMSPLLGAGWTLAATMLVTGGLHEDGLADSADGFGGGATTVRKLAIMRDSRIGTYGVLALLLSVLIRASAITALEHPVRVMTALLVAGVLGRAVMLVVILVLRPARDDGLGALMGRPRAGACVVAFGIAMAVALTLLPPVSAAAVIVASLGSGGAVARLAHRQIGGYTGDVLGAGELVAECVVLTVIALRSAIQADTWS